MTRTEIVLETLSYSPLSNLTRLLAREHFIQFSSRESFKFYSKPLSLPRRTPRQTDAQGTMNKLGQVLLQDRTVCTRYLCEGITFWTPLVHNTASGMCLKYYFSSLSNSNNCPTTHIVGEGLLYYYKYLILPQTKERTLNWDEDSLNWCPYVGFISSAFNHFCKSRHLPETKEKRIKNMSLLKLKEF